MPPNMVYRTTPTGNKKQAAAVGMPVSLIRLVKIYHSPCLTYRSHNSGASSQQHRSDKDVGKETKDHKNDVRDWTVSGSNNLKEGMCIRCSSFQLDSNRSK